MSKRIFSDKAVAKLKSQTILVVGCGGLGGFVIDGLVRMGATKLIVVDSDNFSESNLNRQVFCNTSNINMSKALQVVTQCKTINPTCKIQGHCIKIDIGNVDEFVDSADVVFDCVDNIETKLLLEKHVVSKQKLLIHGAVNGYFGQAALIKQQYILQRIYDNLCDSAISNEYFAVATVASMQLALYAQALEDAANCDTMYTVDTQSLEMEKIK